MINPGQLEIRLYPFDHVYLYQTTWWDLLNKRTYYDAVIHAAAITNLSTGPLTIGRLSVQGQKDNQLVSQHIWRGNELLRLAEPINARRAAGLGRSLDLVLFTHLVLPAEAEFASSLTLLPNQALVIPNLYLSFHAMPDRLSLVVNAVEENGMFVSAETDLKAIEYTCLTLYSLHLTPNS